MSYRRIGLLRISVMADEPLSKYVSALEATRRTRFTGVIWKNVMIGVWRKKKEPVSWIN